MVMKIILNFVYLGLIFIASIYVLGCGVIKGKDKKVCILEKLIILVGWDIFGW